MDEQWGYVGEEVEIVEEWKHTVLIPKTLVGIEDSPGEDLSWDDIKDEVRMMHFVNPSGGVYDQ